MALEEAPNAVALLDAKGGVLWANRAFYTLSDGVCRPDTDFHLTDLLVPVAEPGQPLWAALAKPGGCAFDVETHAHNMSASRLLKLTLGPLVEAIRPAYLRDMSDQRQREEALKRAEGLLEHTAVHDPLTGLPNRRGLLRQLGDLMRRAEDEHRRIGVCLIDIDQFRMLNESRGHEAGDELLIEFSERLRRLSDPDQVLARIGGDLFAVVSPEMTDVGVLDVRARRMRSALAREVALASGRWSPNARMGLAIAEPGETDPATLLMHAEVALADAKGTPDGDVGLFSQAAGQRFADRSRLAEELCRGIDEGQFAAHFQPQIRLEDGRLAGFEALVRWHHPERGILEPCYFLEAAEQLGLESTIDALMIDLALDALLEMRDAGHDVPRISINFSARSMRDPERVDLLAFAVEKRGLQPSDVVVEVLESTMIVDATDPAASNIDRLARSGFRVELDDFGTGYAALSNVARLNIHALKIDRSLVQLMLGHQVSAVVVSAIIALAKQIGISVIAEGIEDVAEVRELSRLGCDLGQGYWFSRPLPLNLALTYLARHQRSSESARPHRLAG
ncbi:MAG: bifunctional diguanylate cyclase/phosphodiesterase [Pseudomonadota bacterium]